MSEQRICSIPNCHKHLEKCNCEFCYIDYLNDLDHYQGECELFCKNCSITSTRKLTKNISEKIGIKNNLCTCKDCKENISLLDKWLWHLLYKKQYLQNKYLQRWLFANDTPGEKIFELLASQN